MKRMICYAMCLSAATLVMTGCSTSHPTATNRMGALVAHLDAPPLKVTEAAVDVCEDMELTLIDSASTQIDGKVHARTAQGSRIYITVNLDGVDASKISIRKGTFGDENISLTLLERIENELGLERKPMNDDDHAVTDEAAKSAPADSK
ncbi:MAG: DUF3568 family protein [Phycisphaeraceae bacterium]|nr:DUF3568 family protein [Phycisphaeraceae bacterium]